MNKTQLATNIYEVIKDYRNQDEIFITVNDIIEWADQFEENSVLILTELEKIIHETYISKKKAKQLLEDRLKWYLNFYKYTDITYFLIDTEFLNLQESYKSQPAILELIEEVLNEKYNVSYKDFCDFPKINYIYFDDVLASGSTIGRDVDAFLNDQCIATNKKFSERLEHGEIKLSISLFCLHIWGGEFLKHRISKSFNDKVMKRITWFYDYGIQNHAKFYNQSLNVAKPIKGTNKRINEYLESLDANKYEDYAYRSENTPKFERFFTSSESRIKFENIITEKGIAIINMIKGPINGNIRPLGIINPSYKIFGLGTHFFTWRNIPNNTPLIYWWEVRGHDWKPLFPLKNRGLPKK